jgi:hypothetical protein
MIRTLRSLAFASFLALMALPAYAQSLPNNPLPNPPAQNGSCGGTGGLVNPLNGICSLRDFLRAILDGVIQIGTIVLVMMLVYVGFKFVVARGNAEELQSAKSALVWTVIGGLILLGAKAIEAVITGTVQSLQ